MLAFVGDEAVNGWRVVEPRGREFDNALVELTAPAIELRVVRDRGSVLVDVRPAGGAGWHSVEVVLEFILGRPQPTDAAALAGVLSLHFTDVKRLMATDLSDAGLLAFESERGEAVRRSIFPS